VSGKVSDARAVLEGTRGVSITPVASNTAACHTRRCGALRGRDEHGEHPALDDVQAGAGVPLPDDIGPGLDIHRLQVRRQPGELHAAEPGEQRHSSEQRFGGGAGGGIRHGQ
jgi:hypothetical protein